MPPEHSRLNLAAVKISRLGPLPLSRPQPPIVFELPHNPRGGVGGRNHALHAAHIQLFARIAVVYSLREHGASAAIGCRSAPPPLENQEDILLRGIL